MLDKLSVLMDMSERPGRGRGHVLLEVTPLEVTLLLESVSSIPEQELRCMFSSWLVSNLAGHLGH